MSQQSGVRSQPASAPGALEAVQDFCNSLHVERGTDALADPATAPGWLRDIGLPAEDGIRDEELAELVRLRTALRDLVHTGSDTGARLRAVECVAEVAAGLRYALRADGAGRLGFEPVGTPVERITGMLLSRVHDAQRDGTWERLKICRSDACAWVFYDHSRNHSAVWCAMGVCGNRQKVSRYRGKR
ncbi:CGNR zinc finger domain-containing protein [Streptomyces roseifaciens]